MLTAVVWIPDPELRALNPDETYGSKQTLTHLEELSPAEWGLPPINWKAPI